MELGHILDYMQRCARNHEWHDQEVPSFTEIGQEIAQRFQHCVQFVEGPFPRYRFEYPEPIFELLGRLQVFTREEIKTVSWTCREMSVNADELFAFDFGNGITMHDLFLISRAVNLMQGIGAATFLRESVDRPIVLYNSLVPAVPRPTLIRLFGHVVGEQKAEAIIELLSVNPAEHVDIFYAPLIPAGDMIFLPVNTFAQANIFRNALVTTRRRLYEDGRVDPLSQTIAAQFEAVGASTRTHVTYSVKGGGGEIDVLAHFADTLFVLECKNSLLPTDVHEIRTSMDYIETAAKQLRRFIDCAGNADFLHHFSEQVAVPINRATKIVAGIVVSNRMFAGLRVGGFPVRGHQELDNFLSSGTIRFGEHQTSLWNGDELAVEDVRRFFEDDISYVPVWNAMEAVSSVFEFTGCTVVTERWRLDGIALAEEFGLSELRDELIHFAQQQANEQPGK